MWVQCCECQAQLLIGGLLGCCGAVKCLPITCASTCNTANHCLILINAFQSGPKMGLLTRITHDFYLQPMKIYSY